MKKAYVILLTVFLFGQCIGVKNKSKVSGQGILALLTGGTVGSNAASHNGNPASGTGNGTSDYASSDIKAAVGGTLGLGTELSLTVPADALDADRTLTVKRTAVASSDPSLVPIQSAYQFGPEDLNFSEPATLKVCYNPELLKSKKLPENSVQIYYLDPDTKELASVGGTVDPVSHCVTAKVEHFSTYIPAVTTAAVLTVSASTVTPARPVIGMPLKIKTKITPTSASPLASAFISYRIKGSGAAFVKVPLTQDSTDTTALSFDTVFPSSTVTAAGLEYFIEATDEAGTYKRLPSKGVSTRLISRTLNTVAPLRFNVIKSAITVTSGSYRNLALQMQDSTGLWQTVFSETNDLSGNAGTLSYIGNTIRFTAGQVDAGTLTSSYGGYSASLGITVKVGAIAKIEVLDSAGAIINGPVNIIKGQTFGFKTLGYDSFGNTRTVSPTFSVANGIGTYNKTTGIFQASATPNLSGTLTATVGKFTDSVNINIIPDSYPISGTVTGIPAGKTVVIQNNGTDDLTLSGDGGFTFASNVFSGSGYNVTLSVVPPGVECSLSNNVGTVSVLPVSDVNLICKKTWIDMPNDWSQISGAVSIQNRETFLFNGEIYMLGSSSGNIYNYPILLLKNENGIWQEVNNSSAIDLQGRLVDYFRKDNDGIYFLVHSSVWASTASSKIRIIKYDGNSFSEMIVSDGAIDQATATVINGNYCLPNESRVPYPIELPKRYMIKASDSKIYLYLSCGPQNRSQYAQYSVYSFDGNQLNQIISPAEITNSSIYNLSDAGIFELNNEIFSFQTKSDFSGNFYGLYKKIGLNWNEVSIPTSKKYLGMHFGNCDYPLTYKISDGKLYFIPVTDDENLGIGYYRNKIFSFDGTVWTTIYLSALTEGIPPVSFDCSIFFINKNRPAFSYVSFSNRVAGTVILNSSSNQWDMLPEISHMEGLWISSFTDSNNIYFFYKGYTSFFKKY